MCSERRNGFWIRVAIAILMLSRNSVLKQELENGTRITSQMTSGIPGDDLIATLHKVDLRFTGCSVLDLPVDQVLDPATIKSNAGLGKHPYAFANPPTPRPNQAPVLRCKSWQRICPNGPTATVADPVMPPGNSK